MTGDERNKGGSHFCTNGGMGINLRFLQKKKGVGNFVTYCLFLVSFLLLLQFY